MKRSFFAYVAIALVFIALVNYTAYALGEGNSTTISISDEKKKWEDDKVVYLTFDDGPSKTTLKVLKILEDEGVKATFFVIAQQAEECPEILKAEAEAGHEICIHTYSHKNSIYSGRQAFLDDYHKAYSTVSDILGREPSKFMRMPGGSSTHAGSKAALKAIRDGLTEEGVYYVDWNISLEDAIYPHTPSYKLLSTFRKELKKTYIDPNTAIVLMHDGLSNDTTPEALPSVIKYFKDNNYTFKYFGDVNNKDIERLLNQRQINRFNQPKSDTRVNTSQ